MAPLAKLASIFCALLLVAWILFALAGDQAVRLIYESDSNWIVNNMMPGKDSTALENYQQEASKLARRATLWLVAAFLVLAVLIRMQLLARVALLGVSFFLFSTLMFSVFEVFPGLVLVLRLDSFPYYAAKLDYLPDEQLKVRNRPSHSRKISNFRGSNYSPVYGVTVPPASIEWSTDKDGFRNVEDDRPVDVILLGDSHLEYGENLADTFGVRLGNLLGVKARNLGVAGYGPPQYLKVLKRYGLRLQPKYAIFAFYEGNDLDDIRDYDLWSQTARERRMTGALSSSFWRRYTVAMGGIFAFAGNTISTGLSLLHRRIFGSAEWVHPNIAILNLGDDHVPKRMISLVSPRHGTTTSEILNSYEGKRLREILIEFKDVCIANNITPIILYIPAEAHVYASYSTQASGKNWLKRREQQIALKEILERAFTQLFQQLELDVITLTTPFESAAKEGRLLYYTLDSHWNSEGRGVAAEFVSEMLEKKFGPFNGKKEEQ